MRCKKHLTDLSSAVGVCATCLRERLFILIEAQAKAQPQRQEHRKSEANPPTPPQLLFPRSVSPYISRRKSDYSASLPHYHQHRASDQRFYSTPQIGRKKKSSLFSNLFRSGSQKLDLDSSVDLKSSDSYSTANTTSSSPSWFSNIFLNKLKKKKSRMYTMSDPSVGCSSNQRPCRGMSPTLELDDDCGDGSSGYTSDNSSHGWKETPRRAAAPVQRRMTNLPRNVSGLAFCLSPLVRASPNRHWNQKGMQPDVVISGENKSPVNPHLGVAAAFCANRSRKVANFGRFHPKY